MSVSVWALVAGAGGLLAASPAAAQQAIDNGSTEIIDGEGIGGTRASPWIITSPTPGGAFLFIGEDGEGTLVIRNGGEVRSDFGDIGFGADSLGRATVTGAGSRWDTEFGLNVGFLGTGFLTVEDGAVVRSPGDSIGRSAGSEGTVIVRGPGSKFEANFDLFIGREGTGLVEVTDGGNVSNNNGILGRTAGSIGTMRVSGAGSTWTNRFGLEVGRAGNGTLVIEDGGTVSAIGSIHFIGTEAGSVGEVTVSGESSALTLPGDFAGRLIVGQLGRGTLTIEDGGTVTNGEGFIASSSNSVGDVRVTGTGSTWTNRSGMQIGGLGAGTLTISDGATVTGSSVVIAGVSGSSGRLNIGAPAGETPAAPGSFSVSDQIYFDSGDGRLVFNHTDTDYRFDEALRSLGAGRGAILHESGRTTYGGDGSAFSGTTTVSGGALAVEGTLGGNVTVEGGGILGGTGTLAGDVSVSDDGVLSPGMDQIGTLTIGRLFLNGGAQLYYQIGAPGTEAAPGTSDTIVVQSAALFGGVEPNQIQVFDGGGAGIGHYRLMTFVTRDGSNIELAAPGINASLEEGVTGDGLRGTLDLVIASGTPGPLPDLVPTPDPGPDPDPDPGPGTGPNPVIGDPLLQYWQDASPTWTTAGTDWRNSGGDVDVAWAGNNGVFDGPGGTVAVEGTQNFRGLQFVSDGYVLGGSGALETVAGGSELRVLAGETATIEAEITGAGGIEKTQNGTLNLTGVNTFTGPTRIAAGTLALQGAGDLSASEELALTGAGVFDISGLDAAATQVMRLSGGAGSEVRLGANDLIVGGPDLIDTTFAGVISGSGGLVRRPFGRFYLTGENTYTGLTTIQGGGWLYLGDGGAGGSIAGDVQIDSGVLYFNRSDDFTFGGRITGNNSAFLRHVGTGTTTLRGDNSGFNGNAVNVDAGTLVIAQGSSLGLGDNGIVIVSAGAALGGGGTINTPSLLANGRLEPGGNALGTLNVIGDVSFGAGSTLALRIAADGGNDALAVTGTASLAGAVEVTAIDSHVSYADGQSYTILTATEPLEGTFTGASMRNHSAFLTPTLRQDSDTVTLDIAVTSDFTIAGDTANQRQTAAALNGLAQEGDALAVFNAIAGLDEVQARAAFDLASGEVHATGGQVIEQATGLFSGTLRGQGAAGLGAASPGNPGGIVSRRTGEPGHALLTRRAGARAWFAPLGGRGSIEGDGNAATLDWWSGGIAGGYEAPVDTAAGNAVAGVALGYLRSRGTVDARRSSLDADGLHIGVYGAWEDGPWQLSGALAYAASHVSTARGVVFGGIDRTARADYWTHSLGFSGEAAYRIDLGGGTTLMPLATLDAGWSGHGGFTETGAGALNLTGASESRTRLDTGIGFGIRHVMRTETGRMVLEGRAVWEHALGDARSGQSLGLAGSPVGFEVLGPSARRDRLRLGAGVAWDIAPDMTLRASYDGVFAGGERTHSGAISLNIRF